MLLCKLLDIGSFFGRVRSDGLYKWIHAACFKIVLKQHVNRSRLDKSCLGSFFTAAGHNYRSTTSMLGT